MKKKIYYNMRYKNISRNFSFFKKILKKFKDIRLRKTNDRIFKIHESNSNLNAI